VKVIPLNITPEQACLVVIEKIEQMHKRRGWTTGKKAGENELVETCKAALKLPHKKEVGYEYR
jgi:hypothetical protein